MSPTDLWKRYQEHLCVTPSLGLSLDISRMTFDDGFFAGMETAMQQAYAEMDALEAGAIANADEDRMVGHYWLRDSRLAPKPNVEKKIPDIKKQIDDALAAVKQLAADVHSGQIKPPGAARFTDLLVIGIGGSALGPMFVADALGSPADKLRSHFIDNTDPDGIARTFAALGDRLPQTLALVISKSGGTPETRNGMLAAIERYSAAGLNFGRHAVAITGEDSQLDRFAAEHNWLARLPMWDWVGGRTSETSAVGLLPAALAGFDIDELLRGAKLCDEATRVHDTRTNPAARLALMWYHATDHRGAKDMVVLPYKDRLLLFSRYLQQLIMESLGKRLDRSGGLAEQGIAVYGNKGSTDQHAYVQQLRDGVNNFFVTFLHVLEAGEDIEVGPGETAGDYLHGFLLGTRRALYENGRQSLTITIPRVNAFTIGVLIALFERAVGFYASLVNINAYNQPGVEAGKKAATAVLALQKLVVAQLSKEPQTAEQIAAAIVQSIEVETINAILQHLAANGRAEQSGGAATAYSKINLSANV